MYIYIYHIIIYPLCKCIHVFVFMNFPWGHQTPPISSCYPLSGCWNGFHDSQTYGKVAMPRRVGNPIKPGIPNQSVGQIYKNKDLKIRQKHQIYQKSWNIWQNSQMACQIKSTIIGNNLNLNPPQAWSDEEEAQLLEIWQILTKAENLQSFTCKSLDFRSWFFKVVYVFWSGFGCWKFRNWWILLNAIVKQWCK